MTPPGAPERQRIRKHVDNISASSWVFWQHPKGSSNRRRGSYNNSRHGLFDLRGGVPEFARRTYSLITRAVPRRFRSCVHTLTAIVRVFISRLFSRIATLVNVVPESKCYMRTDTPKNGLPRERRFQTEHLEQHAGATAVPRLIYYFWKPGTIFPSTARCEQAERWMHHDICQTNVNQLPSIGTKQGPNQNNTQIFCCCGIPQLP